MRNSQNSLKKQLTSKLCFGAKLNSPSPEQIQVHKMYSITINPSDHLQHFDEEVLKVRFAACDRDFYNLVIRNVLFHKDLRYKLYPEINKNMRWHLHGWIYFSRYDSIIQFYHAIKQIVGDFQIEIDTISDFPQWYLYCVKTRHLMEPLSVNYPYKNNKPALFVKQNLDANIP